MSVLGFAVKYQHIPIIFVLISGLGIFGANSAPPEHTDPALHEFFESQKVPGTGGISCCSVSDGRVVDYRINNGHFEVLLTAESFPWVEEDHLGWRPVDDRSVLQGKENPIGKAVAWVAHADYGGGSAWGDRSFKKDDVMCLLLPSLS